MRLGRPWSGLLAAALLLAPPAAVWFGGVAPWLDRRAALIEEVETARAQLRRFAAAARAGAVTPTESAPGAAFDAADPMLAAAELQATVEDLVSETGGVASAAQPVEPEPAGAGGAAAIRIGVVLDANFADGGLVDFLHAIETASPFLFVDRLEARALERPGGPEAAPTIVARVSVFAYAAAPPSTTP